MWWDGHDTHTRKDPLSLRVTMGYCNQSSLGTHRKEIPFSKDRPSQPSLLCSLATADTKG